MPARLPNALKALSSVHAVTLDARRWYSDVENLIEALDTAFGSGPKAQHQLLWQPRLLLPAGGLLVIAVVALVVMMTRLDDRSARARPDEGAVRVVPDVILEAGSESAKALATLPDAQLVSGGAAGVRLWSLVTAKVEGRLGNEVDDVLALTPLPDGRLAAGRRNGTITVWNLKRGEAEATLAGHAEAVTALAPLWDNHLAPGSSRPDREALEFAEWSAGGHAQRPHRSGAGVGGAAPTETCLGLARQGGISRLEPGRRHPPRQTLTGRGQAVQCIGAAHSRPSRFWRRGRGYCALERRIRCGRDRATGARTPGHRADGPAG